MTRRIALISEHASPLAVLGGVDAGGQNVYVAQVARHLAARGDQVEVYTRRDDPALPDSVDMGAGVRVIHVPAGPPAPLPKEELLPHMQPFLKWMVREWAMRGRRCDLVHAHFFMSGQVALGLRRTLGVPYVVTFHALGKVRRRHQGADDGFPADREAIEAEVAAGADRVIAECPQDEDDLVRLYGVDPGRITIVPCGYDPAEFEPGDQGLARRRLGLDPAGRLILQLGRIVRRKGVDTVIEALARARQIHGVTARLLVVGGSTRIPDPDRDAEVARLMELATAEGVRDQVCFAGRRDRHELADFYRAADVFVSTPWYEPFGITPLEAMACGTPVIGSSVGGIKYTVRDGETGFLVPPRDPDALAQRLTRLLADDRLRDEFARRGIERVRRSFTWRHVTDALSDVYEDVLADRRVSLAAEPRPAVPRSQPVVSPVR
jgi:glycosyltransferase involved in cell wall biosynthesis